MMQDGTEPIAIGPVLCYDSGNGKGKGDRKMQLPVGTKATFAGLGHTGTPKSDPGTVLGELDPYSAADMTALAVSALGDWRESKDRSAGERRAARRLAFAVGRLAELGALPAAGRAR